MSRSTGNPESYRAARAAGLQDKPKRRRRRQVEETVLGIPSPQRAIVLPPRSPTRLSTIHVNPPGGRGAPPLPAFGTAARGITTVPVPSFRPPPPDYEPSRSSVAGFVRPKPKKPKSVSTQQSEIFEIIPSNLFPEEEMEERAADYGGEGSTRGARRAGILTPNVFTFPKGTQIDFSREPVGRERALYISAVAYKLRHGATSKVYAKGRVGMTESSKDAKQIIDQNYARTETQIYNSAVRENKKLIKEALLNEISEVGRKRYASSRRYVNGVNRIFRKAYYDMDLSTRKTPPKPLLYKKQRIEPGEAIRLKKFNKQPPKIKTAAEIKASKGKRGPRAKKEPVYGIDNDPGFIYGY